MQNKKRIELSCSILFSLEKLLQIKVFMFICRILTVWYYINTISFNQKGDKQIMDILKVSSKSNPNSVAGALAGVLRENGKAEMQAIGAGALNQSVKAVAIARGFVAPSGLDLVCVPAFTDIEIEGEERTAIKLIVEPR